VRPEVVAPVESVTVTATSGKLGAARRVRIVRLEPVDGSETQPLPTTRHE